MHTHMCLHTYTPTHIRTKSNRAKTADPADSSGQGSIDSQGEEEEGEGEGGEERRGRRRGGRMPWGRRKGRGDRKAIPHLKVFKSELHLAGRHPPPEQQATPPKREAGQQGIVWQRRGVRGQMKPWRVPPQPPHSAHLEKVGWNAIKDLRGAGQGQKRLVEQSYPPPPPCPCDSPESGRPPEPSPPPPKSGLRGAWGQPEGSVQPHLTLAVRDTCKLSKPIPHSSARQGIGVIPLSQLGN